MKTPTKQKKAAEAFKRGAILIINNSPQFKAMVRNYGTTDKNDPFGNIISNSDLENRILLVSLGATKNGEVSFKIAIGVAWRSAVIQTNITLNDHPLSMGIEKYVGPKLSHTNLDHVPQHR